MSKSIEEQEEYLDVDKSGEKRNLAYKIAMINGRPQLVFIRK